jgi:putative FmdB family regulatory protein
MPIFEYRCQDCQFPFEEIVLSKNDAIVCPKCHGKALEKLVSPFSAPTGQSENSSTGGQCACTPQTCGCR